MYNFTIVSFVISLSVDQKKYSLDDIIKAVAEQMREIYIINLIIENSHDVVLQLSHSIADIEDSDNSQLQ